MPEPPTSHRYLHGHHEAVLRSHRQRTAENSAAYLLPRLRPDARVLDVGCGPGTITVGLAERVPDGVVVGVDAEPVIVDQARSAPGAAERANLTFEIGDVYHLAFDDASFDVVHAHQVLQHLSDPVAALAEMARVCRPGGIVAARDSDYAAKTWYPRLEGLDRWLACYRAVARHNGAEPDAGRPLLAWAHAAGIADVPASASAWCFATPEERSWWGGLWSERVTVSALSEQIVAYGLATPAEVAEMGAAWLAWSAGPDSWFGVLHGEILCRPGRPSA